MVILVMEDLLELAVAGAGGVFVFDSVTDGYIIAGGGGGGAAGGSWDCGGPHHLAKMLVIGKVLDQYLELQMEATDLNLAVTAVAEAVAVEAIAEVPCGGGGSDCGGGGGGDCFTDITMITLESNVEIDGQVKKVYYEKPISEIKVGDYVVNKE